MPFRSRDVLDSYNLDRLLNFQSHRYRRHLQWFVITTSPSPVIFIFCIVQEAIIDISDFGSSWSGKRGEIRFSIIDAVTQVVIGCMI